MHKIITTTALTLAICAGSGSPAGAQSRDQRERMQLAAELRMVLEQQQQLALSMAQLAQALAEATAAMNGRIDETNAAMVKGFANQSLELRTMADDLSVVRERTQEGSTRLGQLREEIEAMRTSLPAMLTRLAPAVSAPGDPLDPNAPPLVDAPIFPDPAAPPPPSAAGLSPDRMFRTAVTDYGSGQYSLAVSGFETFLRYFPTHSLADDAHLYIGDAEYAQNRFPEAIAAYNLVIQKYPAEDQVPAAYYKRGLVQQRLEQFDAARDSYEQAMKFENSPAAGLAKQRLDGLTRTPPP